MRIQVVHCHPLVTGYNHVLYQAIEHYDFDPDDTADSLTLATASGLYPSRSEARRQIQQGGLSISMQVSPVSPVLPGW